MIAANLVIILKGNPMLVKASSLELGDIISLNVHPWQKDVYGQATVIEELNNGNTLVERPYVEVYYIYDTMDGQALSEEEQIELVELTGTQEVELVKKYKDSNYLKNCF